MLDDWLINYFLAQWCTNVLATRLVTFGIWFIWEFGKLISVSLHNTWLNDESTGGSVGFIPLGLINMIKKYHLTENKNQSWVFELNTSD